MANLMQTILIFFFYLGVLALGFGLHLAVLRDYIWLGIARITCGAEDQIQVNHMQSKCLTLYVIFLAPNMNFHSENVIGSWM